MIIEGDEADRGNALADLDREARIASARSKVGSGPVATGFCLHCDEPLEKGRRFCGAECRDGWEEEEKGRVRNGY